MAPPRVPVIDWRDQWAGLEAYIQRGFGVAHIHAGEHSASSRFAKTLRTVLAARSYGSVQLDSQNSYTHYLSDILAQIEVTLGMSPYEPEVSSPLAVGTGNTAGRDFVIKDVTVVSSAEGGPHHPVHIKRHSDAVAESLSQRLTSGPIALIFLNSHLRDASELNRLASLFWTSVIETLPASGLLLVDVSEPVALRALDTDWPPPPDVVLELPERFQGAARDHAADDLAQFAVEQGFQPDASSASVFADTLLGASLTVRELHSNLANYLYRTGTV